MLTAKAVARMRGSTTLTMVELIGPVDANRQTSAATIAVQYTAGVAAVRATSVRGAATSVTTPESQRYACRERRRDRKSTRLNSSHLVISYAVFCLKKKNTITLLM